MKVAKWISAGILLVIVLFLSIYALFPEEAAEPVVSRIAIESASGSQENTASTRSSSDRSSKSGATSKPSKRTSSSKSSSSETFSQAPVLPLNINTATKEDLCQIDGISEELARLIVLYREKAGGYTSIEDLKKIAQLGYNTYDKIKDSIYCE